MLTRALCFASLIGLAAACSPIRGNVDAFSAVDRESVGLPVLGMRWRYVVVDRSREPKPQEFASPVIYNGGVYIGSNGGTLYSLDARRGTMRWKRKLGSVSSRPVADLSKTDITKLYVGTDDGAVVCLSSADGEEKWRYSTRGPILQTPVLSGDTVYLSNEADQVYALSKDTGKFRWQYKAESPEEFTLRGHAGVAVEGGLVFTGFSNGTVVALRASTGTVAWMTSLKGEATRFVDVDGTPVIAGNTVYVTASAAGVYALDKETGLVRWRLPIKNAGGLAVDGERVYVAAADSGVYAIDLGGNIVWRQGTRGGGEPARPLISGEYLIYTLSDGGVFIANKRTGVVHQYFDPGHGVSATPTVSGDRMYILSNGGILYAMNIRRF